MKKEFVIALALSTVLGYNSLVMPIVTSAQEMQNPTDTVGTTTNTQDNSEGFDWWWLLPLSLLPVAIVLVAIKKESEDEAGLSRGKFEQAAFHDIEREKDNKKAKSK